MNPLSQNFPLKTLLKTTSESICFIASAFVDLTKYNIHSIADAKHLVESSRFINDLRYEYGTSIAYGEFEPTFSRKHHARTTWRSRVVMPHRSVISIWSINSIEIEHMPHLSICFRCFQEKNLVTPIQNFDIVDVFNHSDKYELVPRIVTTEINGFKINQLITIDLFRKETLEK